MHAMLKQYNNCYRSTILYEKWTWHGDGPCRS